MVRINYELLDKCNKFYNPLHVRELDLSNYMINSIENMSIFNTYQFEMINFDNNYIHHIDNFIYSLSIKYLSFYNNQISSINIKNIILNLPNLTTLNVSNNLINDKNFIISLGYIKSLTNLIILNNPIIITWNKEEKKKNLFRLYIISVIPSLKILNYQKVKVIERKQAQEIYGTISSTTIVDNNSSLSSISSEKERLKLLIKQANTLDEINRLEKLLQRFN